jgi:hypothetical protein
MNVVTAQALLGTVGLWVLGAIVLVVAGSYFLRPRTRKLYPGGTQRYLLAIAIQATGFIAPIPVVLVLLLGQPLPPGLDVILAVAVGLAVVYGLRFAPFTGPLLKDLHKARVDAMVERLGRPKT